MCLILLHAYSYLSWLLQLILVWSWQREWKAAGKSYPELPWECLGILGLLFPHGIYTVFLQINTALSKIQMNKGMFSFCLLQVTDHATTALLHYQLPQMPDVVVRSFMVSVLENTFFVQTDFSILTVVVDIKQFWCSCNFPCLNKLDSRDCNSCFSYLNEELILTTLR